LLAAMRRALSDDSVETLSLNVLVPPRSFANTCRCCDVPHHVKATTHAHRSWPHLDVALCQHLRNRRAICHQRRIAPQNNPHLIARCQRATLGFLSIRAQYNKKNNTRTLLNRCHYDKRDASARKTSTTNKNPPTDEFDVVRRATQMLFNAHDRRWRFARANRTSMFVSGGVGVHRAQPRVIAATRAR